MVYDPRIHHCRSIRLRGYDYAGGGAYFFTICTQNKIPQFGRIVEGDMILNDAGRRVQKTWDDLPQRFHTVILDAFQMMPNHSHGVFVLPRPRLHPALAEATGALAIQPAAINRPWGEKGVSSSPLTDDGRRDHGERASPPPTTDLPASRFGPRLLSRSKPAGPRVSTAGLYLF
jgi:hypothetical protein